MNDILKSIKQSPKDIKVLPVEEDILNLISENYNINKESLLGKIVFNTGGIIVDNWIRIYGAGRANLYKRNHDFPYDNILVAEDILGGLFAFMDNVNIGYFAPDTLEWEDMEIKYSQFIYWCLHGDTDTYYKNYRWNDWKNDIEHLSTDYGISFYPFLWAEANSLEERFRRKIPMEEIIRLQFDFANQLNQ